MSFMFTYLSHEGTLAGFKGHGTVGYAAAVDAAIDAIVGRGLACSTDREA